MVGRRRAVTLRPVFGTTCHAAAAVAVLLIGCADANAALAQAANPAVPTREELERGTPRPSTTAPRVKVEDDIEHSPCALDNPAYANIRFRLTKAVFANLGPVPESMLADSYSQYLDTDQPISVVCRIRDAAAT